MFYVTFSKSRYDSGELCCLCSRFIRAEQFLVRTEIKIAHFKCAKEQGWQKKRRAKKRPPPVQLVKRAIKVIKRKDFIPRGEKE